MAQTRSRWRWFGGGATLVVFAVLLGIRLGLLQSLISAGPQSVPLLGPPQTASDTWMNISQNGRKIGYANRSLAETQNGFRYSEQIFMQINTMGIVQPLTVRTAANLKTDRTLEGFQFDLASNLFRFTARGEVAGNKLTLHSGVPGQETTSLVPLTELPYLGGGILESVGAQGLKKGEGRTLPVFDPASLAQRPVRITLLGDEELTVSGEKRQARKLAIDFMGVKQVAWVDPDGSVLREEGILGIVLEQVAKTEALAGLEGAVSADLTEIAAIPSPAPIAAPEGLTMLTVRLGGITTDSFPLDGGRQVYRTGLLTIRRESAAGSFATGKIPSVVPPDSLKPSPLIQSDHPRIVHKVTEIVTTGDPQEVKARKIVAWVYTHLQKRPVLSVPNALETLENGVGDCNEHAVLVAALARAAGIPAELEAGVVYLRGRFYYHAWNVLFVGERGGWVTADAVLGQMPADVTHIRFVRGGADRQVDLLGLIGKLKMEILEMKR
jgi:hypothetical protein